MSASAPHAPGRVRALTETTFGSAIRSRELVVVDFWASWCAPCRRFSPVFAAVAAEHPEVLFASVDTESEPGLAAAANIRALPTLMLFRDGLLVQTHQGGLRASRLTRMLETVRALNVGSVGAGGWSRVTHRAITAPLRWGLRENLPQFLLLVAVNALVGATLGQERTVLPLLATEEFGLDHYSGVLTYILAFGLAKAGANYLAGTLSDRHGRKPVLVAGWMLALPVPVLMILAPTWGWVVAANVLLGISQGLTWSTTVVMKMDLVGPHRRGTAMGLNEAAGYLGVAGTATATGYLAEVYGLRPAPFLLGAAFITLGLGLSVLLVRETRDQARHEPGGAEAPDRESRSDREVFVLTSFRDRSLSSISQAGLVNNLNDGLAWGLFPVLFATAGLPLGQVGVLAAVYPAVWGAAQLVTGALSDRWGRKGLIVAGMLTQALALILIAACSSFPSWLGAMALLGLGTAMVYPTLLAGIGDVAHPLWRARAVGVYRLWRDGGFAVGALVAGITADALGLEVAVIIVAALTAASGVLVALRMRRNDHLPTPALHTPGGT